MWLRKEQPMPQLWYALHYWKSPYMAKSMRTTKLLSVTSPWRNINETWDLKLEQFVELWQHRECLFDFWPEFHHNRLKRTQHGKKSLENYCFLFSYYIKHMLNLHSCCPPAFPSQELFRKTFSLVTVTPRASFCFCESVFCISTYCTEWWCKQNVVIVNHRSIVSGCSSCRIQPRLYWDHLM